MCIEPVNRGDDPRLAPYRILRDPELLRERGLFIAESRRAVETLLTRSRFSAESIFVEEAALRAMEPVLSRHAAEIPIYLGTRELMKQVAGFNFHRGCLAAGSRGRDPEPGELIAAAAPEPDLLVVAENVSDPDNVGALFRNASAFGCSGIVLTAGCAEPLYRKAIRVSLGASLVVPFAIATDWPGPTLSALRRAGYCIAALTPRPSAVPISPDLRGRAENRIALLVGAEETGLSQHALDGSDLQVRIPMADGVDSINVATATAIALHAFRG